MAVPQPFFDCNIDSPVEVEGSPSISVDEVTNSRIIKRAYAVKKDNWVKLGYAVPDPQISNSALINEAAGKIEGPVLFFDRNYAEIPAARVEPREVAFTLPGRSAVQYSKITGLPIGWSGYGAASPQTQFKVARVEFSYAKATSLAANPQFLFIVPAVSALTYKGSVVDYSGNVYVSVGNVTIPQPTPNPPISEPRFQLDGTVGGFFSGQDWVLSVNISRWRGPIWQMEVVKIPTLILP